MILKMLPCWHIYGIIIYRFLLSVIARLKNELTSLRLLLIHYFINSMETFISIPKSKIRHTNICYYEFVCGIASSNFLNLTNILKIILKHNWLYYV